MRKSQRIPPKPTTPPGPAFTIKGMEPLAERLRPRTLDEVLGQPHLTGERGLLRRMLEAKRLASMVLFGPPGTGKTTLAHLLAEGAGKPFLRLSAVEAGLKEVRQAVETGQGGRGASSSSWTRSTASTRPSRTPSSPTWSRASSP